MNDEIREILEQLEWYRKIGKKDVYYPECVLSNKKAFILLDYITNLQQENERLKIKCDFLVGKKLAEIDKNAKQIKIKAIEQEDYKSRVEKAVEYIKENQDMVEWIHIPGWDLLNILQNGSDEE